MSWGKWGKNLSTQEMIAQMNTTLDAGITTFDHADIYGDYTTESEFGKAFSESGIERESVQIISKCGIQYVGETRANRIKHYDYSKEYIIWSVEKSLKDLHTDYLDVLLLHRPSPLMEVNEIASAIAQLKEEGKIIDFGVSNFTPPQIDLLTSQVKVNVNQIEFDSSFSATSLHLLTKREHDIEDVLKKIIKHLNICFENLKKENFSLIDEMYLNYLLKFNKWSKYKSLSGEVFEGKITGVLNNGLLSVENRSGKSNNYDLKEISFVL